MKSAGAVFLLSMLAFNLPASAATMAELLREAQASAAKEKIERQLEGGAAEQLRQKLGAKRLIGIAQRKHDLDQPGCARYSVLLRADGLDLGTVSLNLCAGGLPPDPVDQNEILRLRERL